VSWSKVACGTSLSRRLPVVVRLKQALRRIATSGIASRGRAQVTARRVDAEV
jgi:hypothetical protein